MAANQTFLYGPGKPQESRGSQLPPSAPPPGSPPDGQGWDAEMWHVVFRAFTSSEDSDPVRDLQKLSELCHLWLRPDLHTTEQILDKLVLEQFMISMPLELQVLVKDHNVQNCKDLEDILRRKEKPKKHTVVSIEGQKFLVENSDVQMAGVEVGEEDPVMDLSTKSQSFMCEVEVHAEHSREVSQEPENQPEIKDVSREQGQTALPPETIAEEGDLEGLRPTQMSEKDPMEDREETTVLIPPEPQLPRGPAEYGHWNFRAVSDRAGQPTPSSLGDSWTSMPSLLHHQPTGVPYHPIPEVSVGTENEENPPEGTGTENADADANPTHDSETDVLLQRWQRDSQDARGSLRRKRPNTSVPQDVQEEGAGPLDEEFSRQRRSGSAHTPNTVGATGRPVGREATQQMLFECAECKKRFRYESQLTIHHRTHTGERPFGCRFCHKRFIQPSDLRVHQRVHTGEKPYNCQICQKSFAHDSTLRGHKKIHTKEKPYPCEICHKCFSHKGNLNVHLRTHTGLRPYRCPKCDQAFRQLGTWKRHQKTHSNVTAQGFQLPSAQEGN